ncbi:MAG: hypothetical protein D6689_10645 [Deltaproteobacteria bacterium]|nr:MAG: hypothetical protein D6689_10645 [Deltaproteobacteria bacterium]
MLATAVAGACGPGGSPPEFDPIADQEAVVGVEFVLELRATDPDGDDLHYRFDAGVPDIHGRADLTRRPDGSAVFRWTPRASDVSDGWLFDFTVSDGSHEDTVTIRIAVRSAAGGAGAPVFREPTGTGRTLDLATQTCVTVPIVVEDADSTSIALTMQEPIIAGSQLDAAPDGLSGTWTWCPSERQIDTDDRYLLTLSADDFTNPPTIKRFLIVLRKPPKPDCPGDAPVVAHTPSDETTLVGLTLVADISDDQGLKGEPLLYYSTAPPADPPDLGAMTQVSMVLLDGDLRAGTWGADVPNPVAGQPAGATADLYYVIVAQDNDDADGDCDHVTQAPATGAYHMTVTSPGGAGGAGVCEPCTADIQCGDAGDLCVRIGPMLDSYCTSACSSDADCPAGYACSPAEVASVDGAAGRQCIPESGRCDGGGAACADDAFEDNDAPADATPIVPGATADLVSCDVTSTTDDEDFFRIDLTADAQVDLTLAGTSASDLDLQLWAADGSVLASSVSLTSSESISACLEPGTYYVRVYAWNPARNPYTLTYARTPTSCGGASCDDDDAEDDDSPAQARATDIYPDPYVSTTNAICAGDDDWYAVDLYDGETVVVDLTFEQTNSTEDLDLHFHDAAGVDLTPCTEENPLTCTSSQGQSATSNEHFEYTVADSACLPCRYYVVVHGWNGSENLYDIRIGLQ